MSNSLIMISLLAKLKGLTSLIEENSFSDIGAANGIPPMEFKDNYSPPKKVYRGEKFDRRSQIYGTKRRNK